MTSKLSWATAAILIVAAVGVGTWAILGGTPTVPPPPPPSGEWVAVQTGTAYGIPAGLSSGVAKVHFMRHASNYLSTDNLSASPNKIDSLTATGQTLTTFPYDNRFDIVVETQVHDDNMGQLTTAYMKVAIDLSYDSGYAMDAENSSDNMENIFNSQSAYKGINVVWDNGGNGYVLRADDNMNVLDVTLWCRA